MRERFDIPELNDMERDPNVRVLDVVLLTQWACTVALWGQEVREAKFAVSLSVAIACFLLGAGLSDLPWIGLVLYGASVILLHCLAHEGRKARAKIIEAHL